MSDMLYIRIYFLWYAELQNLKVFFVCNFSYRFILYHICILWKTFWKNGNCFSESGQKANADTTPKTYRLIYRPTYYLCWDQEDSIFYRQKKLICSLENRTRIVEKRFPCIYLSNSLNPTTNLKLHFSQIPYPNVNLLFWNLMWRVRWPKGPLYISFSYFLLPKEKGLKYQWKK